MDVPWLLVVLAIFVGLLSVILILISITSMSPGFKRVCIVVLGDIGRSPRMQYHALSFAKRGWNVDIVGYGGSAPHPDVVSNQNIQCIYMREPPVALKYVPRLLVYFIKVIWQCLTLCLAILRTKKSFHILVQNPPAIPTLAVVWFMSVIRGSQMVIDWHNYGYTILALAVGKYHPIVFLSRWFEKMFGRLSEANICVTQAMAADLKQNWNISAIPMYDRPPSIFMQTEVEAQHHLFMKLAHEYPVFGSEASSVDLEMSKFTQKSSVGEVSFRDGRPALVVSSTSWTEDEDFSVLLSALEEYDHNCKHDRHLPDIVCVITGKGPLKEYYLSQIKQKNLSYVSFCTPWLTAQDYPLLLGSADLGVCLHTSSSGLDLPMKVVDMFGCGIPVCAVHFNCLAELVKHGFNGMVFKSPQELAQQIQELLIGFPNKQDKLLEFRINLKEFQKTRWEDCWEESVASVFQLT